MKKSFSFRLCRFVPAGIGLLLSACHSGIQVKVDSLAKPGAEKSVGYRIEVTNPDLDRDSLHFREAERMVKTALSKKGLYETPKPETADIVIAIDYGMSDPKILLQEGDETVYNHVYGQEMPAFASQRTVVNTVVYEKYLRLSARENNAPDEGQPATDVWKVDVITEGRNRNLRKVLPALTAATIEFVGVDSRGEKVIRLKDNDPNGLIAFVKKGM